MGRPTHGRAERVSCSSTSHARTLRVTEGLQRYHRCIAAVFTVVAYLLALRRDHPLCTVAAMKETFTGALDSWTLCRVLLLEYDVDTEQNERELQHQGIQRGVGQTETSSTREGNS